MAFVNDAETEEVIRKCLVEMPVGDGAVLRGTLSDAGQPDSEAALAPVF